MAELNSFRKMQNDKTLIRRNAHQVELHNIFFEDGFNPPGRNEEQEEEDEQLFQHIMQNGIDKLPELVVRPRQAGGVWAVDGHRRTTQIRRAIAAGLDLTDPKDGKVWIRVTQFEGNDEDRLYFIIESNRKKDLKPHQLAHICKQLRALGRSNEQIAGKLSVSKTTIENYLTFGDADAVVQNMVNAGEVSMTNAVHVVRSEGENAAPILAAAVKAAKEGGKGRVTAKALKSSAGATRRDLAVAEAIRSAVLDLCRDTVSGAAYDAALDLDLAAVIAKEVK